MWKNIFIFLGMLAMLTGCGRFDARAETYVEAFEMILFEEGAHLEEVDYISIFIDEEDVPSYTLRYIQQTFIERYDKKVYTYKLEDIPTTGPYGKENFREHGVFLYLSDLEEEDDKLFLRAEKYYTRKNYSAVEVEMEFEWE